MKTKTIIKLLGLFVGLLLSVQLTACGGGSETADTGGTQQTSTSGQSTTQSRNVALSWTPPTTYIDDTSLGDLAGYNIYQKQGDNNFIRIASIDSTGISDHLISDLEDGEYIFGVSAVNDSGVESDIATTGTISIP